MACSSADAFCKKMAFLHIAHWAQTTASPFNKAKERHVPSGLGEGGQVAFAG